MGSRSRLRIGFVDLIDAAPLIVASRHGFFADEGLNVELERQLGWGNIRDRLTFGQLDAAHALLGMPLFSQLHRDWLVEPLVAVMNLGAGGDAITISARLASSGVRSATTLGQYIQRDPRNEALCFGHVFGCSMHHYLLREWLASGGIHPDVDVRLRVLPPNQMAGQMQRGRLDGFCVGEPWNTVTELNGAGQIITVTTDILPNHPEKVLAVSRRWHGKNRAQLVPLIRALIRACAICDDPRQHDALADLLARPEYLNTPEEILRQSLNSERSGIRTSDWRVRSFSTSTTFPSKTHSAWLASQMIRWGHLPRQTDIMNLADRCVESAAYRTAAESLGIACPANDFPPMPLHHGGLFQMPLPAPVEAEFPTTVERV
jgi:ABC-type nitrate/sulfonate/bicarbonate transport system substrate-binding protein